MNTIWLLQTSVCLLSLYITAEGSRSHNVLKTKDRVLRKAFSTIDSRIKGRHKPFLKNSDAESPITKRQFMYPAYGDQNYPVLKPPPIRHFVVHHHAG